jgi:ketosteroid isomerase-like protein
MSNRAIAEGYFQAISRGDVEGAIQCLAPNAEFIAPVGPLPVPDGVRAYLAGFEESFPGARVEINNSIEAGDQVALEAVWTGRHKGVLQLPDGRSIPPTNREVRAPFVGIFRVRDGKIVAHRGYWDLGSFMAQLTG